MANPLDRKAIRGRGSSPRAASAAGGRFAAARSWPASSSTTERAPHRRPTGAVERRPSRLASAGERGVLDLDRTEPVISRPRSRRPCSCAAGSSWTPSSCGRATSTSSRVRRKCASGSASTACCASTSSCRAGCARPWCRGSRSSRSSTSPSSGSRRTGGSRPGTANAGSICASRRCPRSSARRSSCGCSDRRARRR